MIARFIIALAAHVVPQSRRAAWRSEWLAELWHLRRGSAGHAPALRSIRFALGAFAHAREVRRSFPRSPRQWRLSMRHLRQDLGYALRVLVRVPGFAAVTIATLGLGIGATTTIFSVLNAVLLEPLPYADADRLVMVGSTSARFPGLAPVNPMDFFDWRDLNTSFTHVVATDGFAFDLVDGDYPERVQGAAVTPGFFDMLGRTPTLGRAFRPADDRRTGPRVVVVSHGFWQRRFGADPGVIGRTLRTTDQSYQIIGVAPEGFSHPEAAWARDVEIWMPLSFIDNRLDSRGARFLQVIGRLKDDVPISQARQEMDRIAAALAERYPQNADRGVLIEPMHRETVGNAGRPLTMLMAAVGFLLLIACANVANLQLTRATDRRRELAVRSTLGAGPARLCQQLLTEGIVLAVIGGALGMAVAALAIHAFRSIDPGTVPRASEIALDLRVFAFALLTSVLTGLIFSLAPALRGGRLEPAGVLRDGGSRTTAAHGNRLRRFLVSAEIALAVVLVVGAGLFVNSFVRLQRTDPGFEPANVTTMQVTLPAGYDRPEQRRQYIAEVVERFRSMPGATGVSYISTLPLSDDRWVSPISIEGRNATRDEPDVTDYSHIGPDYFSVLRIPLIAGRSLTVLDDEAHTQVVVVNETFATRFWPGERAIGKRVGVGRGNPTWYTVVGVTSDVRRFGLDRPAEPEVFFSALQRPPSTVTFVVRTEERLPSLISMMRARTGEVDDRLPLRFATLEGLVAQSITVPQFYTALLSAFAAVALVLAAVGIYGTMAYIVRQRRRELGIRIALGATGPEIWAMVLRQGSGLAAAGIVTGLIGAVALSRLLESFLFGISARDMTTYAAASACLAIVALAACYLPARSAGRLDVLRELRD